MIDEKGLCGECRYWHPRSRESGECRLDPPVVVVVTGNRMHSGHEMRDVSRWPTTKSTDWCGCFDPKMPEVPL